VATAAAGALSLYVKALHLLHAAARAAQVVSKIGDLAVEEDAALMSLKKSLRVRFAHVRLHASRCRELASPDAYCDTLCAESLVWLAAVDKCRRAAAQELLGEPQKSQSAYLEALVLLETLLMGDEIGARDRAVVQDFGDALTRRLAVLGSASHPAPDSQSFVAAFRQLPNSLISVRTPGENTLAAQSKSIAAARQGSEAAKAAISCTRTTAPSGHPETPTSGIQSGSLAGVRSQTDVKPAEPADVDTEVSPPAPATAEQKYDQSESPPGQVVRTNQGAAASVDRVHALEPSGLETQVGLEVPELGRLSRPIIGEKAFPVIDKAGELATVETISDVDSLEVRHYDVATKREPAEGEQSTARVVPACDDNCVVKNAVENLVTEFNG
jgi:hypothetical protein